MTIKIDLSAEEEQGECEREEPRGPQRTSSGLVSTQRSSKLKRVSSPGGDEAAAIPGAARGDESLLTIAKREAARRMLYSKFYRGEVLRGEDEEAVVSIKGGMDERAEGRERKKKRKREEGGGEGEGEGEGGEHEKETRKKKKKKQKKDKDREKEKELEKVEGVNRLSRPSGPSSFI